MQFGVRAGRRLAASFACCSPMHPWGPACAGHYSATSSCGGRKRKRTHRCLRTGLRHRPCASPNATEKKFFIFSVVLAPCAGSVCAWGQARLRCAWASGWGRWLFFWSEISSESPIRTILVLIPAFLWGKLFFLKIIGEPIDYRE